MPFPQTHTTTANPAPTSFFPTPSSTYSNISASPSTVYMTPETPPRKGVRWAERLEYDVPPRRRFPSSTVRAGILTRQFPSGARKSQASTTAALHANTHANGLWSTDPLRETPRTFRAYVAALERQYDGGNWWGEAKVEGEEEESEDEFDSASDGSESGSELDLSVINPVLLNDLSFTKTLSPSSASAPSSSGPSSTTTSISPANLSGSTSGIPPSIAAAVAYHLPAPAFYSSATPASGAQNGNARLATLYSVTEQPGPSELYAVHYAQYRRAARQYRSRERAASSLDVNNGIIFGGQQHGRASAASAGGVGVSIEGAGHEQAAIPTPAKQKRRAVTTTRTRPYTRSQAAAQAAAHIASEITALPSAATAKSKPSQAPAPGRASVKIPPKKVVQPDNPPLTSSVPAAATACLKRKATSNGSGEDMHVDKRQRPLGSAASAKSKPSLASGATRVSDKVSLERVAQPGNLSRTSSVPAAAAVSLKRKATSDGSAEDAHIDKRQRPLGPTKQLPLAPSKRVVAASTSVAKPATTAANVRSAFAPSPSPPRPIEASSRKRKIGEVESASGYDGDAPRVKRPRAIRAVEQSPAPPIRTVEQHRARPVRIVEQLPAAAPAPIPAIHAAAQTKKATPPALVEPTGVRRSSRLAEKQQRAALAGWSPAQSGGSGVDRGASQPRLRGGRSCRA
ncbi:hypothetical protein IAT38_006750 [Cryptococcus sp. DSM 104549]